MSSVQSDTTADASLGEIERMLAALWRELLRVEQIGRDDNFFKLGGHSLAGLRLTMRLGEQLGMQLPVLMVFRHPTFGEMARFIARLRAHRVAR
jgi:acyl carrier protein